MVLQYGYTGQKEVNMAIERRKKPTIIERLTPCECCNHPLSNRHHILDFAVYGENDKTLQLCPNCHELYHICYKAVVTPTQRIGSSWDAFVINAGYNDPRVLFIMTKVQEAMEIKQDLFIQNLEADTSDFSIEE